MGQAWLFNGTALTCPGRPDRGGSDSGGGDSGGGDSGGGSTIANTQIGYIGDSTTVQSPTDGGNVGPGATDILATLTPLGWDSTSQVSGVSGRKVWGGTTTTTEQTIDSWRTSGFDPSTWLFALGNNSWDNTHAQWLSDYTNILDKISGGGGTYVVFLLSMSSETGKSTDSTPAVLQYRALVDLAATYTSSNVTVHLIDYNSLLHDGSDESGWWQDGGVHMTSEGYEHRNATIAAALMGPDLEWRHNIGPVSVNTYDQLAHYGLSLPSDANYVLWNSSMSTDVFTVCQGLSSNDILVLPERDDPYTVSTFYHNDTGQSGGANPLTDNAGARTKRGIVGLGPRAVIALADDFPTFPEQTGTAGVREAIVECYSENGYVANVHFLGRDVGGVAFDGMKFVHAHGGMVERVSTKNHYGFKSSEPGESFGIDINDCDNFTMNKCFVDGANSDGEKEGSGGFRVQRGSTYVINDTVSQDVRGAGFVAWASPGPTTLNNCQMLRSGNADIQGSPANLEVGGTITFNDCNFVRDQSSGNHRQHIFVVSCATTPSGMSNVPLGAMQVYINNPTFDEDSLTISRGGTGGKYHGTATIQADIYLDPANTPVIYG